MDEALEYVRELCEELGWDYEIVKDDFLIYIEQTGAENYKSAAVEYIEETLHQGEEF
ncbi:hypothetical protein [Bacillus sp. AFS073361]|uniref:hypothetical protein n=1 Tax=Bacillus sp. AFS073361 TaxID=2033511 RepID=UPI0015D48A29|nr:hypothetical protein [Bacillus sp. AFS073361]